MKLRWIKVPTDKVPGNTAPLAMIETWRLTQMGYVNEHAQPAYYKLQAQNENGEWADVEIGKETTTVTRFVGGKAVTTEE